jgi:single-strand DNA-binding protein
MNNVTLVGRLTRDPELRYIASTKTAVATFTLAVDRDYLNKDGEKETDFINIEVWNKAAENCANYITKGSLVAVKGSIRVESYQNQMGEKKYATKVRADRVNFLDSKKKNTSSQISLDPGGFQAIDDDDIPF